MANCIGKGKAFLVPKPHFSPKFQDSEEKKRKNFVNICKFAYICQTEPRTIRTDNNEPMKKLFRFFAVAMMAITLCSCGGSSNDNQTPGPGPEPEEPKGKDVEVSITNVSKIWNMTKWSPATDFPGEGQELFLELMTDGTFNLYQKNINFSGVVLFEGNYTLDTDAKTITGKYSDGVNWASTYTITSMKDNSMQWTVNGEISTFEYTEEIPSDIKNSAIPAADVRSESLFRMF